MGSFVSPAPVDVAAANAAIPVGAVGSYAMLGLAYGAIAGPGSIYAGSMLRYANTYSLDSLARGGQSNLAPAGSWKLLGYLGSYDFISSTARVDLTVSVYSRVA